MYLGHDRHEKGIIPARAGFTLLSHSSCLARPDHPRSRGVYDGRDLASQLGPGSSPLARGLHPTGSRGQVHVRIIPARAGFTADIYHFPFSGADHPRSRGVYSFTRPGDSKMAGSSPLARGLRCPRSSPHQSGRIIPARAGFTHFRRPRADVHWDHPRSRGVYAIVVVGPRAQVGSSPLARGLLLGTKGTCSRGRIIPARAGFTADHAKHGLAKGDHPRSRGVYAPGPAGQKWVPGSSPLARGLRVSVRAAWKVRGIIPARAGFT